MKKKVERLKRIKNLISLKEKLALVNLGKAHTAFQTANSRKDELSKYLDDYSSMLLSRTENNVPIPLYLGHQSFLSQLDALLLKQNEICQNALRKIDEERKVWSDIHERLGIIQKQIDKKILIQNNTIDKKNENTIEDYLNTCRMNKRR